MARIPYATDIAAEHDGIVQSIRERRGGELLTLDRMLLNSPPFAAGWNAHLGAVRSQLQLSPRLRELAICGVAILNGAEYEFVHHAPLYVAAGGSDAAVQEVRAIGNAPASAEIFSATEIATLRLTLEMTRSIAVSDATLGRVRETLPDDRQVVELVGIIATYNMVSRFLVALGVDPEANHAPMPG